MRRNGRAVPATFGSLTTLLMGDQHLAPERRARVNQRGKMRGRGIMFLLVAKAFPEFNRMTGEMSRNFSVACGVA